MAKVNAPVLSIGASGQIGKTQVYANWRGIPYARHYVTPSNPRSAAQTKTRSVFTWLSASWKTAPADFTAPWTLYATGQKFLDRNAYIGQNTKSLVSGTDLTDFIGSPGAKGGLPPLSAAGTPSSGAIAIALSAPSAPAGWTLTKATGYAVPNHDPHATLSGGIKTVSITSTFTAIDITGLAAGSTRYGTFLQWTKPDGTLAYSTDVGGIAIVT